MIRSYSELIKLKTFEERFRYLRLSQSVGASTFGFNRYVNQAFYASREWKNIRREIILRDEGCDLAIPDRGIFSGIRVHHMNPVTVEDISGDEITELLNPEYLICTSLETHNAIHFGNEENLITVSKERQKGDTTLWKVF